jgi:hypothetical protein
MIRWCAIPQVIRLNQIQNIAGTYLGTAPYVMLIEPAYILGYIVSEKQLEECRLIVSQSEITVEDVLARMRLR